MTSDESLDTPMNHRWAVLNCAVTQVLGTYATEAEAGAATPTPFYTPSRYSPPPRA